MMKIKSSIVTISPNILFTITSLIKIFNPVWDRSAIAMNNSLRGFASGLRVTQSPYLKEVFLLLLYLETKRQFLLSIESWGGSERTINSRLWPCKLSIESSRWRYSCLWMNILKAKVITHRSFLIMHWGKSHDNWVIIDSSWACIRRFIKRVWRSNLLEMILRRLRMLSQLR